MNAVLHSNIQEGIRHYYDDLDFKNILDFIQEKVWFWRGAARGSSSCEGFQGVVTFGPRRSRSISFPWILRGCFYPEAALPRVRLEYPDLCGLVLLFVHRLC